MRIAIQEERRKGKKKIYMFCTNVGGDKSTSDRPDRFWSARREVNKKRGSSRNTSPAFSFASLTQRRRVQASSVQQVDAASRSDAAERPSGEGNGVGGGGAGGEGAPSHLTRRATERGERDRSAERWNSGARQVGGEGATILSSPQPLVATRPLPFVFGAFFYPRSEPASRSTGPTSPR